MNPIPLDDIKRNFNVFYEGPALVRKYVNWAQFKGYVNGKDPYVTRLILSTTGQQVSLDDYEDKNKALQDMAKIVGKIESGPADTGRAEVAETPTQKDKRL